MFVRDANALGGRHFDLLVVGGGINGLAIAWDAALRGLSVALCEKGDFGGGATAGCFKIVHGGFRYLQNLDFSRLFRSVKEQRILRTIAPHFVQPLPILVPSYGFGKKSRAVLDLGATFYEILTAGRNNGVDDSRRLPRHSVLGSADVLRIAPHLRREGLRGGIVFYDAQMRSCERLTLAVAKAASRAGAAVSNYLELYEARLGEPGTFVLRDVPTGAMIPIRARSVVNAAGAWSAEVGRRLGLPVSAQKRSYVRGVQLVLPELVQRYGLAVDSSAGRSYFLAPWQGRTLAGTSEERFLGDPGDAVEWADQAERFLSELRMAYPAELLRRQGAISVFGGLIPVEDDRSGGYRLQHRDQTDVSGMPPVVTVSGVKYTTFRILAAEVVDQIETLLGRSLSECVTDRTLLPGSELLPEASIQSPALDCLSPTERQRLIEQYGSELPQLLEILESGRRYLERIALGEGGVLAGELVHFARNEMAQTLDDVLKRRSTIAAHGAPQLSGLKDASRILAGELAWSDRRLDDEVLRAAGSRILEPI